MSIVCEKQQHNGYRYYIETTYETKNLYVYNITNVWLYCIESSLGGRPSWIYMLINIPSLELYIHYWCISVTWNPDDGYFLWKQKPEHEHI